MFDLGPTPLDVRLIAFGIPIRVHPSFWLMPIFVFWHPNRADRYDILFIAVICTFFSVLIHELGHAITAELFGWPSQILLYFMGGVATSERIYQQSIWKNIAVSIMGPGAGFLFYGVVLLIKHILKENRILLNEYAAYTFLFLEFMNLWWGVLNLLPVLPLDGGHICGSVCQLLRIRDPIRTTYKISAVTAGIVSYYGFVTIHEQFLGVLMLMLCLQCVAVLTARR